MDVKTYWRTRGVPFFLLVLLGTWVGAVAARAESPTAQEYFAIVRAARQGDPADAVRKFQAFADAHPADPLADDAWLEIARLREEKFADYAGALEAYRRVVASYPDSKSARRARFRIEKLEADRRGGDEPLRRYREVLGAYGKAGADASVAAMRGLVRDFPGFGKRDEALLWIADQEFRLRRLGDAEADYRRVLAEYPGTKTAFSATRGLGDVFVERRDFAEARRWYSAMASYGNVFSVAAHESAGRVAEVREFENLRRAYWAALAVLAAGLLYLVAGTRWKEARKTLTWRSFAEVPIYLALAAVPAVLLTLHEGELGGVAGVLAGGTAVVLTLNRAFLAGRTMSPAAKLTHGFVMALLICGLIYSVFYAGDLVNITWDTLRADFTD